MKRAFTAKTLYTSLISIFFFLSLVIPTTNQIPRGLYLLILIFIAFVWYSFSLQVKLHNTTLALFVIAVSTSAFFVARGMLSDAPGAIAVSTVYISWPLLYAYFIGLTNNIIVYDVLQKTIVIAAAVSASMGIFLVSDTLFGLGLNLSSSLESLGASVGIYPGLVSYSLYNMSTIIYAFPFITTVLLLEKKATIFQGWWRLACFAAFLLCGIAILVSGRRALVLTSALSPFIAYAIAKVVGVKTQFGALIVRFSPFVIVVAIFLAPRLGLDFSTITSRFLEGFQWTKDPDAMIRAEQAQVLLAGWMERPLLGHGLGASAEQVIRDEAQPWAYELTYLALLFQTGIVGFIIYLSLIISLYCYSIRIIKNNRRAAGYFIPTLTALTCFLIANATNPYLGKFDYLWTIFLPVGLINVFLLNKARGKAG